MRRFIEDATSGAILGGMIGTAAGTLLAGATLMIPGIGPVIAAPILLATEAASTVSLGAVGTMVGGSIGGAHGACEDAKERKARKYQEDWE